MISKTTVDKFLEQKVNDWSWVKKVSENDLLEALSDLTFKVKPFKHQLASILVGITNPHFLFFLDMGLGKSKVIIDLLKYRIEKGEIKRALILVPNETTIGSWRREVEKHTDLKCIGLTGTILERMKQLDTSTEPLVLLNYTGFQIMNSAQDTKFRGKRIPASKAHLDNFASKFQCIVYDEIQNTKNFKSLTSILCREIAHRLPFRYGLTGTPTGRDPQDLWPQFNIVDKGATLGETITLFRQAFFDTKINHFGGYEYKFKKKLESLLHKKMQNKSIRYAEKEAHELPPLIFIKVPIETKPDEMKRYYQGTLQEFKQVKGHYHKMETCFIKLRQITSGFLHFIDDEERVKETITFDCNPKLEALFTLIDGIREDKKIVIFNEFIYSGDLICQRLDTLKIQYRRLYSGTKDKIKAVEDFIDNPKIRIFLANSQSGSVALNLQIAKYVIFYESPVSVIVRSQAEKRCHRIGQTERVFIYDLVIKDSVDERILGFLKEGKDLFKSLVEGEEIKL